jgi:hypothetical protein
MSGRMRTNVGCLGTPLSVNSMKLTLTMLPTGGGFSLARVRTLSEDVTG